MAKYKVLIAGLELAEALKAYPLQVYNDSADCGIVPEDI